MANVTLQIIPLLFILGYLVTIVATAVWAYNDAKARGKPGILAALLVLFGCWPLGLIAWLLMRPERTPPPFDLQRYRQQ